MKLALFDFSILKQVLVAVVAGSWGHTFGNRVRVARARACESLKTQHGSVNKAIEPWGNSTGKPALLLSMDTITTTQHAARTRNVGTSLATTRERRRIGSDFR